MIIPPLFLIRMILMGPILSVKSIMTVFTKRSTFCNTAIYHVKNVPFSDKALTSKREAEVRFFTGVLLLDSGGNIWRYLLYGSAIGVYCYGT